MKITSSTTQFLNPSDNTLFCKTCTPANTKSVFSLFIVPGFTQLGTKRYTELQKYLARRLISSFSYDYQGIGKSEGSMNNTTISDLIEDTKSAFYKFRNKLPNKNFIVLGYSLGAYIIPKMLSVFTTTKGVVLVSPPAYSSKVDSLCLDDSTTELIRSVPQDKNSEIFTILKNNNKPTLIIFGDNDQEISLEIRGLFKSINSTNTKYVSIENSVHSLLRNRSPIEKVVSEKLSTIIYDYIQELCV